MIDYEGKPLEDLSMLETIEFEKQMLKKVLAASKAHMGEGLIDQINLFILLIRDHKMQLADSEMYKRNEKEDGTVLELGEIAIPPDLVTNPDVDKILADFKAKPKADVDKILAAYKAKSAEEILDFYKKK